MPTTGWPPPEALLGLVVPGLLVDDVACTAKTIPDFPGRWAALVTRDRG